MSEEHPVEPGREEAHPDAVCMHCGNANPESAIRCPHCGEDLVDQRAKRLAAGQDIVLPGAERRWLRRAAVVGAVVMVVAALIFAYSERLGMLFGKDKEFDREAAQFWQRPWDAEYDEMTAILETAPLTVEVIEAANPFEPNGGPMEGRYILRRGLRPSAVLLGHALVRETGGDYIFAALLTNGTELRGRFDEAEEGGLRSELTGVRDERGVHAANGRAEITAPGVFEFTGQFTVEEGSVTGTATRTPE